MPVFGLVFRVMRTTLRSCCYSVGCSSELSDPLQLSFPIQNMISAKVEPKPQQPLAFMSSPLMLCPKAQRRLHGKKKKNIACQFTSVYCVQWFFSPKITFETRRNSSIIIITIKKEFSAKIQSERWVLNDFGTELKQNTCKKLKEAKSSQMYSLIKLKRKISSCFSVSIVAIP